MHRVLFSLKPLHSLFDAQTAPVSSFSQAAPVAQALAPEGVVVQQPPLQSSSLLHSQKLAAPQALSPLPSGAQQCVAHCSCEEQRSKQTR
jgi:hypothetical protein